MSVWPVAIQTLTLPQKLKNPLQRRTVHVAVNSHAIAAKLDLDYPGPSTWPSRRRCRLRRTRRCCGGCRSDLDRNKNRHGLTAQAPVARLTRQVNNRLAATPCRRATPETVSPPCSVSSTSRTLSS
jgi:hypothetical protein